LVDQSEAAIFQLSLPRPASAFALVAVLLSIVGCANRGTVPATPSFALAPTESSHVDSSSEPNSLVKWSEEVLSAKMRKCRCAGRYPGQHDDVNFSVSGVGKGPYAGAFIGTGFWRIGRLSGESYWMFVQHFEVTSRSHTFSGRIVKNGVDVPNPEARSCKHFKHSIQLFGRHMLFVDIVNAKDGSFTERFE
jgi:hypothetical protein